MKIQVPNAKDQTEKITPKDVYVQTDTTKAPIPFK